MDNQQGSMIIIMMALMSFLLLSATFLWRSVIAMHDSAIARQQYMYKKAALEDLLYYAIAQVQKKGAMHKTNEYTFEHWPLHTQAQFYWQATVNISIADVSYRIHAHLYDKEQVVMTGSCVLTTTVVDHGDIWFIDAWTLE
jgi:hypothetical protein